MKSLLISYFLLFVARRCLACTNSDGSENQEHDVNERSDNHHWSYADTTKWCEIAETCCGQQQSPIDLPEALSPTAGDAFVFEDYDAIPASMEADNNGHSVNFIITSDDVSPKVSGGGLNGTYIFSGLHFHWGDRVNPASEHTLDGKRFNMEVHLVHYSASYSSINEAIESGKPDALAVLGFWIEQQDSSNGQYSDLLDTLSKVKYADDSLAIPSPFPLNELLPLDLTKYYRYQGSLTTPNCNEVVTWTIFQTPVILGKDQIRQFQDLFFTEEDDAHSEHMVDNFRPVQPLNDRTVLLINAS